MISYFKRSGYKILLFLISIWLLRYAGYMSGTIWNIVTALISLCGMISIFSCKEIKELKFLVINNFLMLIILIIIAQIKLGIWGEENPTMDILLVIFSFVLTIKLWGLIRTKLEAKGILSESILKDIAIVTFMRDISVYWYLIFPMCLIYVDGGFMALDAGVKLNIFIFIGLFTGKLLDLIKDLEYVVTKREENKKGMWKDLGYKCINLLLPFYMVVLSFLLLGGIIGSGPSWGWVVRNVIMWIGISHNYGFSFSAFFLITSIGLWNSVDINI